MECQIIGKSIGKHDNVHFVDREPDSGKRDKPKEEESHEVSSCDSSRFRKMVRCTR